MAKDLFQIVGEYRVLLEEGRNLEVIEHFYAGQVVQIENADKPVVGKEKLLAMEKANLARVECLEQKITSLLIDEEQGLVMGEMTIRFSGKEGVRKRLEEAFVQRWKGGKIIWQRFYYSGFLNEAREAEESSS